MGSLEEIATTGTTTTTTAYYGGLATSVNGALSYTLADGLGSVSESVNASTGAVTATQLYAPYGAVRYASGTLPGSRGFTGQHSDAATSGLDYYGARYYDPAAGQFTSADTTLAGGLNRYAYVGGNPEVLTDPSGHDEEPPDERIGGYESSQNSGSTGGAGDGNGDAGDGSGVYDPFANLKRAINWIPGQDAITRVIPLGNQQRITLYMDGVSLQVIFSAPGAPDVNINVTKSPQLGMWSDILTKLVNGGAHAINQGTDLGDSAAAVNRIVQQLQQATGGTIGTQLNGNPLLQIVIKGQVKTAEFRVSPDGTLPGGTKGGPEFRVGIGSGKNIAYLTFGGTKSTQFGVTHFWLGPQVYDPDVAQAMVFTMMNQYYQQSFATPPSFP